MADRSETNTAEAYTSFKGVGWSFPPRFTAGGVVMSAEDQDIQESLAILFGTAPGERLFESEFGLDMRRLAFESLGTTEQSFLRDRIETAILIFEPRIKLLRVELVELDELALGSAGLALHVDYEVRSSNTRFNRVYPFYRSDSSEVRTLVDGGVP